MICTKTVIAVLLLLGITVSSLALNLYISQSIFLSKSLSGYDKIEKALDYSAVMLDSSGYVDMAQYITDHSGKIEFFSVVSTQFKDMDVIGINAYDRPLKLEYGEWVKSGGVVLPYDTLGEGYELGDEYYIKDNKYIICGFYSSLAYFDDDYSSRAMTLEDYTAAGVKVSEDLIRRNEDDYDMSVRDVDAAFISYADFVKGAYEGEVFRIKFGNSITPMEKNRFSNELTDYCAEHSGCQIVLEEKAMNAAESVYGFRFVSKFLIYIFISIVSLINTLALTAFVIKQDKDESMLFMSLGASISDIVKIRALEIVIYLIPSYTCGFFLSKLFIRITGIENSVSYYGAGQFVAIFAVMLVVSLLYVTVCQIGVIRNKYNQKEPIVPLGGLLKKGRNKKLYLILQNYSGSVFSEILILMQVILVAFSFAYVCTFEFQIGSNSRIARKMTNGADVYICGYSIELGDDVHSKGSYSDNLEHTPLADEAIASVAEMEGLNGWGTISQVSFVFGRDVYMQLTKSDCGLPTTMGLHALSPYLIDNIHSINLSEGVWLEEWKDGVDIAKDSTIPVVVSPIIAEGLGVKCGDIIKGSAFVKDMADAAPAMENGRIAYYDFEGIDTFDMKIVGILDKNTRIYAGGGYPPRVESAFPLQKDTYMIYCPVLYKNDRCFFGNYMGPSAGILLFPDGTKDIEYYRKAYERYGPVFDLKDIADAYDDYYQSGNSEYEIHLYITTALLIIGVAGYNLLSVERNKKTYGIYYSCGMHWKKSLSIAITSNSIIFLSGGIIGTVWGIVSANSTRVMAGDTIIYSAITSIGFIIILFALSTISIFAQISKLTPISLIRKGE